MTHSEGTDPAPGREYITGRIVSDGAITDDGVIAFEGDRIAYAGPAAAFDAEGWPQGRSFPPGTLLLPGLIDVHCHGGFGTDFSAGNAAAARASIDYQHRSGTTTLMASTVADAPARMTRAVSVLAGLAHEGMIAGIHVEGPFLAVSHSGAQNPAHLINPDLMLAAELIDAGEGRLLTMTYAPELPGADELVDLLVAHGVTPSIGHTGADAQTTRASLARALDQMGSAGFDGYSGRPTVTHLYNAMPPAHHRSPGPVPVLLRAAKKNRIIVELIADGAHLSGETVASTFDLVGAGNIALVTDSTAAAGMAGGRYPLGPSMITARDGVATVDDTEVLAGGTASMLDVVRTAVAAGVPLVDAVTAATTVPADILGLADEAGSLRLGLGADLVAVTAGLELQSVLRCGRWLERTVPPGADS